jgi:adenylate cyclase
MNRRISLTLSQVFLMTLLGLLVLLGLLFYLLLNESRMSILKTSDRLRLEVGLRVRAQVVAFRNQAEEVAGNIERQLQNNLIQTTNRDDLEAALFTQVLNHPDIGDVSFTHADAVGEDHGTLMFSPDDHWELSVYRDDSGNIIKRRIAPSAPNADGDPTTRFTFTILTSAGNLHRLIWSDLHYSELSSSQVEVSVQESIFDARNKFLGVVRVGLLVNQLSAIVQRGASAEKDDPLQAAHTCFLCDSEGRLITPVGPGDRIAEFGDDLRIRTVDLPAEIHAALHSAELANIGDQPTGTTITIGDKRYLVSFLPLPRTQDWVLAVLADENVYLGDLIHARNRLLGYAALVMILILIGGIVTVRTVQRGLNRVVKSADEMRLFEFAPTPAYALLSDLQRVLESLEQAKTAIRAMGKYVPLDLVRQLYEKNREPQLGGEIRDLSIFFTDIQGFTTLSETLTPGRLAVALGEYFRVLAAAIHDHAGTIDKYIGDSVMAIWNAPTLCENHPIKACAAALACAKAAREVGSTEAWRGLPPPITRCGLHHDSVMLGHFGSPDRMSYTCLGDGVNLASRLEGLNKQYGTNLLVSQSIYDAAKNDFQFRLLDRVAVKGKSKSINVYELLTERTPTIEKYESALHAYWQRDFTGALAILKAQSDDPPSLVLSERCEMFLRTAPPADWDGTFISMMK